MMSRRFLCALPALFALALPACQSDDPAPAHERDSGSRLISVWREKNGVAGKQHLAIFHDDRHTHSDHFLLFGEKNGKLKTRSFVGQFIIFDNAGSVEKSQDHFYDFTAEFETDDLMKVTLIGRNQTRFDLVFEKVEDEPELEEGAALALDSFYAKFDRLVEEQEVDTLAGLKAHIRLHQRSHDFGPNDDRDIDWQFELEFLQIEGHVDLSSRRKSLAGVDIRADGSDPISKHFKERFGQTWTSDADLPDPEEVLAEIDDSFDDPPFFLQFEEEIFGVTRGPIQNGLEKFAKFTITVLDPFECEDSFDYIRDYHWVLADGSILSYETHPECD